VAALTALERFRERGAQMVRAADRATVYSLETAAREDATTSWSRYEAKL